MSDLYMNSGLPPEVAAANFRLIARILGGSLTTFPPDFVPPALLDPNYVPPSRAPLLRGFAIATLALAVIAVAVRVFTRRKRLGWDDHLMLPALVCFAGYTAVHMLALESGMGIHIYDVTLKQVSEILRATYTLSLLYTAGLFCVKISLLIFYHQLAGTVNYRTRIAIISLAVFVLLYTIAALFSYAFVCRPAHAYWNLDLRFGPSCPDKGPFRRFVISISAIHVITDFVILCLPMRMVWQLRMRWTKKLSLVLLFGAGGVACIASSLRLAAFPKTQDDIDISWNIVMMVFWGQMEMCLAIVASSTPALRRALLSACRQREGSRTTRVVGAIRSWSDRKKKSTQGTDSTLWRDTEVRTRKGDEEEGGRAPVPAPGDQPLVPPEPAAGSRVERRNTSVSIISAESLHLPIQGPMLGGSAVWSKESLEAIDDAYRRSAG